jgi:hypothetical protein
MTVQSENSMGGAGGRMVEDSELDHMSAPIDSPGERIITAPPFFGPGGARLEADVGGWREFPLEAREELVEEAVELRGFPVGVPNWPRDLRSLDDMGETARAVESDNENSSEPRGVRRSEILALLGAKKLIGGER